MDVKKKTVGRRVLSGLVKRLINIIFAYPTDTWEFANSLLSFGWGFWLLMPQFNTFDSSPRYFCYFAQLAPEWVWGLFISLVGLLGFASLFHDKWSMFRVIAAALSAFVWITVWYGFFLVDWRSTAIPMYGIPALMSAIAAVRLYWLRVAHNQAKNVLRTQAKKGGGYA